MPMLHKKFPPCCAAGREHPTEYFVFSTVYLTGGTSVPWGSAVWNIFSELDANSIRIARELRSPDSICIFLRTRRNKADPDLLAELREVNHFLYPGDEIRFLLWPWRRKKLLRFFFLSENTDENFQRIQDLLTAAGKDDLFTPRNVQIGRAHV